MNNHSISPKKKFQILLKLMKNNKFTPMPPIIENNQTFTDPKQVKFLTLFLPQSQLFQAQQTPQSYNVCKMFQTWIMLIHHQLRLQNSLEV